MILKVEAVDYVVFKGTIKTRLFKTRFGKKLHRKKFLTNYCQRTEEGMKNERRWEEKLL